MTLVIGGCDELLPGRWCEVTRETRALHFFLGHSAGGPVRGVEVRRADGWQQVALEPLPRGVRFHVALAGSDTEVQLRWHTGDGAERRRLHVRSAPSWPWRARLDTLDNATAIGELRARLLAHGKHESEAVERAFLGFELGRREYRVGNRRAGAQQLEETATLALALDRRALARKSLCLIANYATNAHAFEQANGALLRAERLTGATENVQDASSRALVSYGWALQHAELGALRKASAAYDTARSWVDRGAVELRDFVTGGQAYVSLRQGNLARAAHWFEQQLAGELAQRSVCARALALSNLGWTELEMLRSGLGTAELDARASAHLRRSVELFEECRAAPPWQRPHAQLNLAFDYLRRGELEAARHWLARAGSFDAEPRMAIFRRVLEAEFDLHSDAADRALARFRALSRHARTTLTPALEWRAVEGGARALFELGRTGEAVSEFERAEHLLARAATQVPLDAGRLGFLAVHAGSAEGLIAAHLKTGDTARAFEAARRARRRLLLALLRRDRAPETAEWTAAWGAFLEARRELEADTRQLLTLPSDELDAAEARVADVRKRAQRGLDRALSLLEPGEAAETLPLRAPASGEVLLLWRPVRGEWHGFAASHAEIQHVVRPHVPSSSEYVSAFSGLIARANRLTILSYGAFGREDLHALPRAGDAEIVYSMDLPPTTGHQRWTRTAVVVGDARGDLPEARAEARNVAARLRSTGFRVTELVGNSLRASALLEASRGAELLHYAGHTEISDEAGFESQLPLSDSAWEVADILALREPPQNVLLAACEAAFAPGGGVGLAHAFLVAGSEAVVASARKVRDADARRFSEALARHITEGRSVAAAYRAGAAELHAAGIDGTAYRLLVP